jgi:hypothetical protein
MSMSPSGYAEEGAGNLPGTAVTTPEAGETTKKDDCLPIHRPGGGLEMDKFSQGNQIIQTGFQTMEAGTKLFMKGEALYLKLK